jgi:hypothetical protein
LPARETCRAQPRRLAGPRGGAAAPAVAAQLEACSGGGRRCRTQAAGGGRGGGGAAGARRRRQGRRGSGDGRGGEGGDGRRPSRAAGAGRRARGSGRGAAGGGRRAAGGGRAAERREVPPRTRLSPASRARIASRPCSANSSAPRGAARIASQPLVRPRSGPGVVTRPIGGGRRAAGEPQGLPHQGPHGPPHQGPHGPPHQGPHGPPHQGPHGPPHHGPHDRPHHRLHKRRHSRRRSVWPYRRTSSRRSRAMPRGRTCRPSGTALVDRQRRIRCRMRMWPKAWPHRHVASPPMPGPHDVAPPRAVWLQGCAAERLQRRNDRASARLRGSAAGNIV